MGRAGWRVWLGRAGLVALGPLLGLALLGALELGLRVAGVGGGAPGYDPFSGFSSSVPLFVPAPDAGRAPVVRISAARLGQGDADAAVDPLREFAARKPPGGFRVFVVGESSAAGVPYEPSHAFAGVLSRALARGLPGVASEVIDAAVSGYGSRRELLAVREIAAYEPDAVVFYGGHNEPWEHGRYGRLLDLPPWLFRSIEGLAGTRSFALASRLLARERLRPEQAVDRFLAEDSAKTLELFALAGARRDGKAQGGEAEAERWFAANLERIADATLAAGARLVLVTLGQDLRDWAPGASAHRPDLTPGELDRWTGLVEAGRRSRWRGDCEAALRSWRQALEIDAAYAELHYRVARCERRLGRREAARAHFVRASDLDRVPLGAPSRYNERLREIAERRGAILVDAAAALETAASGDAPGRELFVDFAHPNLRGHQVIGDAIARALRDHGLPRPAAEWGEPAPPVAPDEIYAARPDYPRREAELELICCLLVESASCVRSASGRLLEIDPRNATAARALDWLRSPQRRAPAPGAHQPGGPQG